MGIDVPFHCRCGKLSGCLHDIDPTVGDHVVCHCSDCLAFLRYLDPAGPAPDAGKGVALFQTRVARMSIASGKEHLACVHLTEKPMLRWFASCCRTALFHTLDTGKVPFVTTHNAILDPGLRDAAIGEPRGHTFVQRRAAGGAKLREISRFSIMAGFFVRMCKDLFSGDYRRAELFDPETLQPVARPIRLSSVERAALDP